jgi:ferredoxin-NADP reductase
METELAKGLREIEEETIDLFRNVLCCSPSPFIQAQTHTVLNNTDPQQRFRLLLCLPKEMNG